MGPTASGTSALALEVARRLRDVEIVSVDSMQVYRGMDVGTAKPTRAEQAEVPHHLLDLADPTEDFSVAAFQRAFAGAVGDIERRGRRALLVGGTGLYLRAVVDGLTMPGRFPAVAAELEADPDTAALHRRLAALDPVAASRMEPANRRRVIRALEVCVGSGRPFSSFGAGLGAHPPTRFRMAGVWLPRDVVARRIEARVAQMLEAGLVEEVRGLLAAAGLDPDGRTRLSRTAVQALGYREILGHLTAGVPLATAVAETVRRTRAFSRRQRMWFRGDPRITWHGTDANPLSVLPALLGDWSGCPA